jgi:hypothetical protein
VIDIGVAAEMGNRTIFIWNIVFWIVYYLGSPIGSAPSQGVTASSSSSSELSKVRSYPYSALDDSLSNPKDVLVASAKFKDEDFVIPHINKVPKSSQLFGTHLDSSNILFILSVAAISLSKFVYHEVFSKGKYSDLQIKPLLRKIRVNSKGLFKRIVHAQDVPKAVAMEGADTLNVDGTIVSEDPLQSHWEEHCKKLAIENASLQEQLLHVRELLKQHQTGTSSSQTHDDDMKIQTLSESLQYWKRVAKMNEQQANSMIQAERRNSELQLEQLKADMLHLVEQERSSLLTEFQNMVAQLRESLLADT